MHPLKIAVSIVGLGAAIFILYTNFFSGSGTDPGSDLGLESAAPAVVQLEPTEAQARLSELGDSSVTADMAAAVKLPAVKELSSTGTSTTSTPQPDYPDLFGYEVGVADISEEDFIELVERLRNDPELLAEVLNELRAETDPDRIKRLTILLGSTGSAEVLPLAEELVYSSNSLSREAGLDLLSRIAPQNAQAYDIANTILGSEADSEVLVSTMNVLARPQNASAQAKATSITQIMPLASHESAAVRRHSVSILVRLTNDETLSPVLYSALSDADASVREAATYAYSDYPYQTTEAVERLIEIIEDPSEERGVRNGAILAISTMSPDEQTQARIKAAKKQMRDAQLSQ